MLALYRLRGGWRWLHTAAADGTYRIERERWQIDGVEPQPDGSDVLLGHYRRDVTVISIDGTPFVCSQQAAYTQIAVYDVRVTARHDEVAIDETAYRTMPSPCEPGFRKLGRYTVSFEGPEVPHATLAWDGGTQTLLSTERYRAAALELPPEPTTDAERLGGAWRWTVRSRDEAGDVRDEDERWELAIGDDGTVGGTYERGVVVSSGDGAMLKCAGATSYGYINRYTVRGALDADGGLRFDEVAVEPGTHPCLAGTPDRHLDSAAGRADGAYLILTWRGQRRQVLHR